MLNPIPTLFAKIYVGQLDASVYDSFQNDSKLRTAPPMENAPVSTFFNNYSPFLDFKFVDRNPNNWDTHKMYFP